MWEAHGVEGLALAEAVLAMKLKQLTFKPPESMNRRITCRPAFKEILRIISVCQAPPVSGTATPPVLFAPSNSKCSWPPPVEAARSSMS